jgi:hypothetical protein
MLPLRGKEKHHFRFGEGNTDQYDYYDLVRICFKHDHLPNHIGHINPCSSCRRHEITINNHKNR